MNEITPEREREIATEGKELERQAKQKEEALKRNEEALRKSVQIVSARLASNNALRKIILERLFQSWSVTFNTPRTLDQYNLSQCNIHS